MRSRQSRRARDRACDGGVDGGRSRASPCSTRAGMRPMHVFQENSQSCLNAQSGNIIQERPSASPGHETRRVQRCFSPRCPAYRPDRCARVLNPTHNRAVNARPPATAPLDSANPRPQQRPAYRPLSRHRRNSRPSHAFDCPADAVSAFWEGWLTTRTPRPPGHVERKGAQYRAAAINGALSRLRHNA